MKKILIFISFCAFFPSLSMAQIIEFKEQHDKEKEKQIKSLEFQKWDFGDGLSAYYYSLFHKDYSGASGYLSKNFSETKSKQGFILPLRTAETVEQDMRKSKTEEERAKMEEVYNIDTENYIDRNFDITYKDYEESFEKLKSKITSNLIFVINRSNGKWNNRVAALEDEYSCVCASIDYIHKDGYKYELENIKRQEAYEEAKLQLEKILKTSSKLAFAACTYF